jgi:outer membrane protein assembly factor BamB
MYVTTYSPPAVVAVNASTGSILWTFAPSDLGALSTTPLVTTGGILYAGSINHKLYALHTSDGSVEWISDTGTEIYESSVALCPLDGTIYIGTGNNIQAISPSDGSLRWTVATAASTQSNAQNGSPLVLSDCRLLVASNINLYLISSGGSLVWSLPLGVSTYARYTTPALSLDGTTVYASSGTYGLVAADVSTGALLWSYPIPHAVCCGLPSPAVTVNGTIIVGTQDNGVIYAVRATGTLLWTYSTAATSIFSSATSFNDGSVVVGGLDGIVYAISAEGQLRWSFTTDGPLNSSPAVLPGGDIAIGSLTSYLYALTPFPVWVPDPSSSASISASLSSSPSTTSSITHTPLPTGSSTPSSTGSSSSTATETASRSGTQFSRYYVFRPCST